MESSAAYKDAGIHVELRAIFIDWGRIYLGRHRNLDVPQPLGLGITASRNTSTIDDLRKRAMIAN